MEFSVMTRWHNLLALSALWLLGAAGRVVADPQNIAPAASSQTGAQGLPEAARASSPGTGIGAGDTITIVCVQSEEISKPWRVGESGDVNLPLIGVVHAAGRTAEQLEADLVLKLKEYFFVPEVTVYVSEFRSQPVTITGAVDKPGIVQLQGNRTLFDTLMLAGGPK